MTNNIKAICLKIGLYGILLMVSQKLKSCQIHSSLDHYFKQWLLISSLMSREKKNHVFIYKIKLHLVLSSTSLDSRKPVMYGEHMLLCKSLSTLSIRVQSMPAASALTASTLYIVDLTLDHCLTPKAVPLGGSSPSHSSMDIKGPPPSWHCQGDMNRLLPMYSPPLSLLSNREPHSLTRWPCSIYSPPPNRASSSFRAGKFRP